MLRGVVEGGARVYLLCPHHAARVLQWLQWWLRGEEEGSRLLLIKPCKCKMQPPSRDAAAGVRPGWDTHVNRQRSQTQRSATCISTERVSDNTDAGGDPSKETDRHWDGKSNRLSRVLYSRLKERNHHFKPETKYLIPHVKKVSLQVAFFFFF